MAGTARTVVVTGASAGVGRAIAALFGKTHWQVGLIARGREGLESAKAEIEMAGSRAIGIETDVADAAALMSAAERIERELGPIDVWVNNAMVTVYAAIVDITPEEFRRVTEVTYLGQVHGALAALRCMRARNRGHIIFIGSALAYRSIPFQGPYCAAKAAVRGFVDSLRSELIFEKSDVKITMIQLPAVNTPQFDWARDKFKRKVAPVPPIFQPETVARAVLQAVRDTPREYWLGTSAAKAIGAQMLMPGVIDRYLARKGIGNETGSRLKKAGRHDNLFEPGRGDPGAHGRFDACANPRAFIYNPKWLRAGFLLSGLAAVAALLKIGATRR